MKENKITIPNPCEKGWNNMTPKDNGRYCSSCSKTVVDFTSMNLEQINHYFLQNSGQKVCGHFKATQVELKRPVIHKQLIKTYEYLEQAISVRLLRTVSLSLVALCMTLVGCQNHTEGEKKAPDRPNQSECVAADSTYSNDSTMIDGEVIMPETDKAKK